MALSLSQAFPASSIHLIAGSPHAGKSGLCSQLADTLVTHGSSFLGIKNDLKKPAEVVYVLTDRPWHDSGQWLESRKLADASGNSLHANLRVVPLVDDPNFENLKVGRMSYSSATYFTKLVLPYCKPDSWVFLDTGLVFLGDLLKRDQVMPNVDILRKSQRGLGSRLFLVTYGTKVYGHGSPQNYAHLTDRVIGCAEFRGAMSTIAYIGTDLKDETGPRHLHIKMRRHKDLKLRVRLEGIDYEPVKEVEAAPGDPDGKTFLTQLGPEWRTKDLKLLPPDGLYWDKVYALIERWEELGWIEQVARGRYKTLLTSSMN